jgi:hypothetical protein
MPSSVVIYRSPRPYTAFTKLNRSQWFSLYQEAIRLGYEPPPAPSLHPITVVVGHTAVPEGTRPNNLPMCTAGALTLSANIFSAQLGQMAVDDPAPVITANVNCPQVPFANPHSLALTKNVLSGPEVFLLLRISIFPSLPTQGKRLAPLLIWQTYAGYMQELQCVKTQYMNALSMSPAETLSATLMSCSLTDPNPTPAFQIGSVDVEPAV